VSLPCTVQPAAISPAVTPQVVLTGANVTGGVVVFAACESVNSIVPLMSVPSGFLMVPETVVAWAVAASNRQASSGAKFKLENRQSACERVSSFECRVSFLGCSYFLLS
jgi:hypothetical protein